MGVSREWVSWRGQWWYPLERDPYYAPSLTMENLAVVRKQVRHMMEQSTLSPPLDSARDADDDRDFRFALSGGDKIPGAGDLRGYPYGGKGVIVTGPCGLRHYLWHSEARALASWLMKMSAEEPT